MTDQIREQVSALLDGELPPDQIGLLVRRMERDPELRRAFGSYSLIGETLRAPGGRTAQPSFAARVSAAIDVPVAAAPVPEPLGAARPAFWKRPAFATAIAAGFALLAVAVVRPGFDEGATTAKALVVAPVTGAASPTLALSQRLASYLVAHSQFSSPMVRRNVLSSVLADDPGLTRVAFESGEAP